MDRYTNASTLPNQSQYNSLCQWRDNQALNPFFSKVDCLAIANIAPLERKNKAIQSTSSQEVEAKSLSMMGQISKAPNNTSDTP